jgi:imidazole glycerol phosphate synthase glutamine amidotransferase subunit
VSGLALVPTGTANLASVVAAFRRLGIDPVIAGDGSVVETAGRTVVPGVGSFGAAMAEVDRLGIRHALRQRLEDGRPTLAICVGMQLLAGESEESAGTEGIEHVPYRVTRFPGTVRVPQLGWNRVSAGPGCRFVRDGWGYFANSYRIEDSPEGWSFAVADHGGRFVAALERGDVLACQFHPELSGRWGSGILESWLKATGRAG